MINQLKDRITTFSAEMLMGSNEVPTNNSTAMGTATLKFNNNTKVFTITVTHNVSSITAGHIHKGAAGTKRSFPFTALASPLVIRVLLLPRTRGRPITNLYYVNLHSSEAAHEKRTNMTDNFLVTDKESPG
jgi:hypothetical protein